MKELLILVFFILGITIVFITPLALIVDKARYRKKKDENHKDEKENRKISKEEMYAKTLGLKGKVKKTDINKAYKKKMKEFHPDRILNMAEELQKLALKRTKEINEAYEYFKKKYGK